jgi:hypothetical protein
MSAYELWELNSGNAIGSFPSQDEALGAVAETIRQHGESSIDSVVLTHETGQESTDIAEGHELAVLAAKVFHVNANAPAPLQQLA